MTGDCGEDAVLADLADLDPYHEVMTDWDASDLRCFFCNTDYEQPHKSSCVWFRARQFGSNRRAES